MLFTVLLENATLPSNSYRLHDQLPQQMVEDQGKKTSSPVLLSYSMKIDRV